MPVVGSIEEAITGLDFFMGAAGRMLSSGVDEWFMLVGEGVDEFCESVFSRLTGSVVGLARSEGSLGPTLSVELTLDCEILLWPLDTCC